MGVFSHIKVSSSEMADDICCLLKEPCVLLRTGPLSSKAIPPPVIVKTKPVNWKELDR